MRQLRSTIAESSDVVVACNEVMSFDSMRCRFANESNAVSMRARFSPSCSGALMWMVASREKHDFAAAGFPATAAATRFSMTMTACSAGVTENHAIAIVKAIPIRGARAERSHFMDPKRRPTRRRSAATAASENPMIQGCSAKLFTRASA